MLDGDYINGLQSLVRINCGYGGNGERGSGIFQKVNAQFLKDEDWMPVVDRRLNRLGMVDQGPPLGADCARYYSLSRVDI